MLLIGSRNRVLLTLAIVLICSFVGISALNYKVTRDSVRAEILRNDLPLTMDNIYSELTSEMMRPLLVASSMASDTFLKDWAVEGEIDPKRVIRYLAEIKGKYDFFTSFYVSAKTGIYYRYNEIQKSISRYDAHDVWYFNLLASAKEYDFDVDTDEGGGNALTIFINYKVFDGEGRLLGITGVGLKVDSIAKRIGEYQQIYHRTVYLADRRGLLRLHPDISVIENKTIKDMTGLAHLSESILAKGDSPSNFEYSRDESRILLTVRYIEALDWFLFVEQNETEALKIARMNFSRTISLGFLVSGLILVLMLVTINRYQKSIELLAVSDALTGLTNRRRFEAEYERSLSLFSRNKQPFSVIIMDLDGFKAVNDTIGHLAGDKVLQSTARLIRQMVRPTDTLSRWGGDEFVILCAGDEKDAVALAERVRGAVEKSKFAEPDAPAGDTRNGITVSCGVSGYGFGDGLDDTLVRADRALYRCKVKGGNGVEVGGEDGHGQE